MDYTARCSTVSENTLSAVPDKSELQRSSALFLLGLKEKHKLTKVAIQEIVEGVTNLIQQRLSALNSQVAI